MNPELTPNPLPCGCVAKYADGMTSPPIYVELCPLHKAAPALLAACKRIRGAIVGFGSLDEEKKELDAAISAATGN